MRALYAEGADFRSSPFRDPQEPGAYAQWAFDDEEPGADVRFGEPFLIEPDRAAVEYWAVVRDPRGGEATIAGVAILRLPRVWWSTSATTGTRPRAGTSRIHAGAPS